MKHTIESIKLKDRVEINKLDLEPNTKNPIDELDFEVDLEPIYVQREVGFLSNKNTALALLVFFLIGFSLLSTPFFSKSIDPIVLKYFSMPFVSINEALTNVIRKPYVITAGEFSSLKMAKITAVKLLPSLKQVNIIQLDSKKYVFQIEKFSSKNSAYKELTKLKQLGLPDVHVRYLLEK